MHNVNVATPRYPTPEELKIAIRTREVDFNVSNYFKKGWIAFKVNFCHFWSAMTLYGLTTLLVFAISYLGFIHFIGKPDFEGWFHRNDGNDTGSGTGITPTYYMPLHNYGPGGEAHQEIPRDIQQAIIWALVTIVLCYILLWKPMKSSFINATFNAIRKNDRITTSDYFSSFFCPYYCSLFGLTLLTLVMSAPLGGLSSGLVSFFGMFAMLIHRDNVGLGAFKSFTFSARAVARHFCGILGFVVLAFAVNFVGLLCFGFGLLVTMPWTWFTFVFMYHDIVRINAVPIAFGQGMSVNGAVDVAPPMIAPAVVTRTTGSPAYAQLSDEYAC